MTESRRILNAFGSAAWAMEESKLEAICAFLEFRAKGGQLSREEVRAVTAARAGQIKAGGGVVVIPIVGVITQRANLLSEYSGGTSTEKLAAQIDQALASADVGAIVFDVDSPGGDISGVPEIAAKIYAARGKKRTIAVVNSAMHSAAYWIGSAAEEIAITPSGMAGSIGILWVHTEYSEMEAALGIKTTILRAGKYKAEGNPVEPLSDGARDRMQAIVDDYYEDFVAAVARHRGTTAEAVRKGYAQGSILTAKRAVAEGLADRVATLEAVLAELGIQPATLSMARAKAAEELAREMAAAAAASDTGHAIAASVELAGEEACAAAACRLAPLAVPAVALMPVAEHHEMPDPPMEPDMPPDGGEDDEEEDGLETAAGDPEPEDDTADAVHEGDRPADVVPSNTDAAQAAREARMAVDTAAVPGGAESGVLVAERDRVRGIMALAREWKVPPERAEAWIAGGLSEADASREILKLETTARGKPIGAPAPAEVLDWSREDQQRFSIVRAINAAADNDWSNAKFERDVMAETQKKLGYQSRVGSSGPGGGKIRGNSIIIPTALSALPAEYVERARATAREMGRPFEMPRPRGALTSAGATAGAELVFTEPGSFIEMLRNRMVTTQMGATFLPGLQGNVDFPRQTAAGTFSWRAENPGTNVSLTDLATGSVELRPNDGTSATSYSRRLLAQSVINVELLIREDLTSIAAIGLDLAALHGAGGTEPTGLYSQSGVNTVAFNGVVTYEKIVEMETDIVASNADLWRMGYVTTPEIRGAAKTTQKFSGTNGDPIWTGSVLEGDMNGYRSMASNQASKTLGSGAEHAIFFGAWQHLLVGEWGAMELIVDPYTLARQGLIIVVIFLIADIAVRYPAAFCVGTNLQLT